MENPHGQRRLAGYSLYALTSYLPGKPWDCKELEHNWGTKHSTIFRSSSVSIQLLTCVWLFVISWTAACQAFLSITNSQSLLKLMSIESVMPSNHLIFCRPLLLPPSIFPSIRVFSNESALRIRWPKHFFLTCLIYSVPPQECTKRLYPVALESSLGVGIYCVEQCIHVWV